MFRSFRTERLIIRRLTPWDAKPLSAYRLLPEVARYQSWDEFTEDKARALVREMSCLEPTIKGKWFQFGLELLSTHLLIGDVAFLNEDDDGRSWIGFTLRPEYWRQGYAKEAVAAVIEYYMEIGVEDVWATVDARNAASIGLLVKLGFALVETKPENQNFLLRGRRGGNPG